MATCGAGRPRGSPRPAASPRRRPSPRRAGKAADSRMEPGPEGLRGGVVRCRHPERHDIDRCGRRLWSRPRKYSIQQRRVPRDESSAADAAAPGPAPGRRIRGVRSASTTHPAFRRAARRSPPPHTRFTPSSSGTGQARAHQNVVEQPHLAPGQRRTDAGGETEAIFVGDVEEQHGAGAQSIGHEAPDELALHRVVGGEPGRSRAPQPHNRLVAVGTTLGSGVPVNRSGLQRFTAAARSHYRDDPRGSAAN